MKKNLCLNNSVYFKDCYSNALVHGFGIFGCSASFIFDNDIYKYYYNDGHISNKDIQLFDTNKLLKCAGVRVNKCYFQINELKNLLIRNLNGECFAILGIDDNVSSYRHKNGNISNSYHNVLVIDYDKLSDSYLIVDSVYQDIPSCKYLNIDSDTLLQCTKGEYQLNQVDFVYPFRENNDFDDQIHFQRIKRLSIIGSSEVDLKVLIDKITEILDKKDYSVLKKILDISELNQIINRTKIALYYYQKIRPNSSLFEYQQSIHDDWYKIRIYILKDLWRKTIIVSTIEKVLQILNHILEIDKVIWDIEKNLRTVNYDKY